MKFAYFRWTECLPSIVKRDGNLILIWLAKQCRFRNGGHNRSGGCL